VRSLENVTRASRPKRLPVVLTPSEVRSVLARLEGTTWLVANLLYGSGLRLMESLRLRVKDIGLERCELIVRDAKGGKDRVTVLPGTIRHALGVHLQKLHVRFEQQRAAGAPGVSLPAALARKYPDASTQWGWQYVFPAASYCEDVYSGRPVRHHMHEKVIQRAGTGGGAQRRDIAAAKLPHVSALLCHPPARGGVRHPHGTGVARPCRRSHHHALHPRPR
jgi:integrase